MCFGKGRATAGIELGARVIKTLPALQEQWFGASCPELWTFTMHESHQDQVNRPHLFSQGLWSRDISITIILAMLSKSLISRQNGNHQETDAWLICVATVVEPLGKPTDFSQLPAGACSAG